MHLFVVEKFLAEIRPSCGGGGRETTGGLHKSGGKEWEEEGKRECINCFKSIHAASTVVEGTAHRGLMTEPQGSGVLIFSICSFQYNSLERQRKRPRTESVESSVRVLLKTRGSYVLYSTKYP